MDNKQFESIIESLFAIVPLLKKDLMKPESDHMQNDLSSSQMQILFYLEDMGVQPMSEIGKYLQVNKSNLTPLVQKLIDKHLVERIQDDQDRRYVKIGLTEKGFAQLGNQKARIAENLKIKLSNLKPDEMQRFAASLAEVKNIMIKFLS
ncbi:MAG: transcriptional regulator [Clostridia bacterium]|jgi:DNA-binding MarR family transcriptional regulator|nr:transcriptional regulator [Clostridia bacterium]